MPRPKKPFQVLRRRANNSKHVFYVSFRLPDGTVTSPRSSGQTSKGAAETWAVEQINEGKIPVSKAAAGNVREDLIAFLTDFWDYDKSKYVRGKLARGGTISRAYCKIMGYTINKYVKPTFEGRRIRTLTADEFDDWMADLAADEAPAGTINLARQCVSVALNHLVTLRRLPWNPLSAVKPYKEVNGKRGTLTVEEFRKLLDLDGLDPRVYVAIALGGLCGMRMGEIRGLRWADVDFAQKLVHIHTSYVEIDGERDQAKHGSNRDVPLPSAVLEALEGWRSESPATQPDEWVVCDLEHPDRPMDADLIREAFYEALESIGIKNREERKIVFHSLRHWYNTQLRGSIPDEVLRRFTGHRDAEMTELYDAGKEIDFEKARARLEELTRPEELKKTGKTR
jgi:integrase